MKNLFSRAVKLLVSNDVPLSEFKTTKKRPLVEMTERELILLESLIGAQLFGPIEPGARREFFCEDAKNWIWYEEWTDKNHKTQSTTTRYEVHHNGILKVRQGDPYIFIDGQELENLLVAVQMYHERVMRDIYKRDPATGKLLK